MIKETVTYKGFDGQQHTTELRFHITRTRLAKNLSLKTRLEEIQAKIGTEPRDLDPEEVEMMLDLVIEMMRIAYGILSPDSLEFDQDPPVFERFKKTAAYDAFLMSLFLDTAKGMKFLVDVMPEDLIEEATKLAESGQVPGTVSQLPVAPQEPPAATSDIPVETTVTPAAQENTEPSDEELLKMDVKDMSPEQMKRAYILRTSSQQ